jgi:hypothetical protein
MQNFDYDNTDGVLIPTVNRPGAPLPVRHRYNTLVDLHAFVHVLDDPMRTMRLRTLLWEMAERLRPTKPEIRREAVVSIIAVLARVVHDASPYGDPAGHARTVTAARGFLGNLMRKYFTSPAIDEIALEQRR